MRVTFPRFPIWNFHFPELDVRAINRVTYLDAANKEQTLDASFYRLAIGRNGVSGVVMLRQHELPATKERDDAVSVEYEV